MAAIPSMFPAPDDDTAWVYLIQTPTGAIKVGRTAWPNNRLAHHRRKLGIAKCRLFEGGAVDYSIRAEAAAIALLSENATRVRRTEVFSDIEWSAATALVRSACHRAKLEWIADTFMDDATDETYWKCRADRAWFRKKVGLAGTEAQWQTFWLAHFRDRREVNLGRNAARD